MTLDIDHICEQTKINAEALSLGFSKDFLELQCSNACRAIYRSSLYSLQIPNFLIY